MVAKDIISVKPRDNFLLELTFDDDQIRVFDFKKYARGKGVLVRQIVSNKDLFLTVKLDGTGTICWDNGFDIAQEYLLEHSS